MHFITWPTNISHWLYKISFLKTFLQFPILNTLSASCDFYRKHRKNHVKKNNTSIWDIFLEKAQHGDLDMINRHPSMVLFFPFSMFWVLGVFFLTKFLIFSGFWPYRTFLAITRPKIVARKSFNSFSKAIMFILTRK